MWGLGLVSRPSPCNPEDTLEDALVDGGAFLVFG